MIWNPQFFPEGVRSPAIGGHVDLNPTLADILQIPPEKEWQGHSLFDPARPNRAFFMAIAAGDVFGVREGEWKYMFDVTSGQESLFQLSRDPDEQQNVVANEPERAKRLRERLAAWVTFEEAFLWGKKD
jgi:arylsulfatase A-like enzyme